MITQADIEAKNFKLYTESPESVTNELGDRKDYIAVGLVGKAEYLVLLQYYTTKNEGYTKIRDFWNDPVLYPEFYFIGDVDTTDQLDKALELTGFEKFKTIEFDKIWHYR